MHVIQTPIDPAVDVNERGHLAIDGCDAVDLDARFGTPRWVIGKGTRIGRPGSGAAK